MPFAHLDETALATVADDGALLGFILQNQPDLVFVKDEQSRLVYANTAFLAIYSPEERAGVVGSTTVESFTAEQAELFLAEDRRALREGRTEMVEEITDWTGRRICLLTRKFAVTLANGERRLVGLSTHITDLAERERRLVRLNAQLKLYSNSVAHDLRNPIASIIGGLNLIERDSLTRLSERASMIMKALRESALGLSNYIAAMLKAAAGEAADLSFRPYDLNILFEELRFNLTAAIEAADMDLNVTRLPTVVCEPDLLRQLFQNLIENAIKHASANRLVVTVHYQETLDHHVFYVGDNGVGISADKRDLVFRQFVRGATEAEGLGLGLTICQRIASLHDGFLELHDRVEPGCCMVVYIGKHHPLGGQAKAPVL